MRMSDTTKLTAADIVNTYPAASLAALFTQHGDEPPGTARRIAASVEASRPHRTTGSLREAVAAVTPEWHKSSPRKGLVKTLSRVFQALRVVVNDEEKALEKVLGLLPRIVRPGGVVVFLTFQSMEDRMVKRSLRDSVWKAGGGIGLGDKRDRERTDQFGNKVTPYVWDVVGSGAGGKKEEIERNRRARSARMRVAVLRGWEGGEEEGGGGVGGRGGSS